MILQRTATHSLSGLGALALIAGAVAGCAPTPAPTPTPTAAFASEEEAFAKAEEVYRAYIDALNAIDTSDPSTFEPVYEQLTGDAETSTRSTFSELYAENVTVLGSTSFDSFEGVSFDRAHTIVGADVCLDVSEVEVVNAAGDSLVSPDRLDRQPMALTFSPGHTEQLKISSMQANEELTCAG